MSLYLYGIRPYVVRTGSMEPAIKTGSVCFVNHKIPFEEIQQGDVIAFFMGETIVTHRAVQVSENQIMTKGDANEIADASPVTKENYSGKTVLAIPEIGYA